MFTYVVNKSTQMQKPTETIPFFLMIVPACYSERSTNMKNMLHRRTAPSNHTHFPSQSLFPCVTGG